MSQCECGHPEDSHTRENKSCPAPCPCVGYKASQLQVRPTVTGRSQCAVPNTANEPRRSFANMTDDQILSAYAKAHE